MAITGTSLEQHVRELFRLLFEARDLDAVEQRYWTDTTADDLLALQRTVRGPAELRAFFTGLYAAVPDWTMRVERVTVEGSTAVIQWHATGHHSGAPWEGIAPTGREIDLRGCDIMRFDADGRLEHNDVYYDGTTFARQVGLLPPLHSAADRALLGAFNAKTRLQARLRR